MCGNPFQAPKIPEAPQMPAAKPVQDLKAVTADQTAARDQALRKMASRLTLANTNKTQGLGAAPAATTTKSLLGQ